MQYVEYAIYYVFQINWMCCIVTETADGRRSTIKFGKEHFLQMNSWKLRLTKTGRRGLTHGRGREAVNKEDREERSKNMEA